MGIRLKELKSTFNGSVMIYIKGSLVGIISLAICTLFSSYWITELADLDARAINLSGSLRMESYQLGMLRLEQQQEQLAVQIKLFEDKLQESNIY
ncbi:type IV pili methyl-accepting chemotaxis transducer N-terminal domain-containing protein [Pseudoalteromonas sp. GB43]